jgi:hypothetical protein
MHYPKSKQEVLVRKIVVTMMTKMMTDDCAIEARKC